MSIKKLSACLISAISLSFCLVSTAFAVTSAADYSAGTEFVQGNIRYALAKDNKTVMVIGPVDDTVTTLAIPEKVNGENVSVIGSEAFSQCRNLKLATISKSVESVRSDAFKECTNLEAVYIHYNDKSAYDSEMFNGCKSLKDIFYEGTQSQFNQAFSKVWDGTIKYDENGEQLSVKAQIHYNSNIPKTGEEQNEEIANKPIGTTCYIPYSEIINGKRYCHPYQVVFRTETDTYLLGIYPYKTCSWNRANDVCQELKDNISIDCNMVGMPSREDIKLFYENNAAVPTTMETWTRTPSSEKNVGVYYRNSKGSYSSVKSKSDECGLCVLIRVSTSQSDEKLLSTSCKGYNAIKQQLELEESEYKLAISKTQDDKETIDEAEAQYHASYASYLSAAIEYNESMTHSPDSVPLNIKGDVNGDGRVNSKDATAILKHTAGIQNLTEDMYSNADLSGDGKVNSKDAAAILKLVVGLGR